LTQRGGTADLDNRAVVTVEATMCSTTTCLGVMPPAAIKVAIPQ
jgi:hypothetical protein